MGVSPSALLEDQKGRGQATLDKIEGEMATLERLLDARANEFYQRLINNKGEDKTVPIKTVIDYKRHISISVKDEPSEELNQAVENLFGGNYLSSLKSMCMMAVNGVLTKASAGEKLDIGYKVLIIHSAVVRVDYMIYGYTSSAKSGVADFVKNGLVMVATVGIVDFNSIGLETLVYLVGTQCGKAGSYINARQKLWSKRAALLDAWDPLNDPGVKQAIIAGSPNNTAPNATPPTVAPRYSQDLLLTWYKNLQSEANAEKTGVQKSVSAKIPKEFTMKVSTPKDFASMKDFVKEKIAETLAEYENMEKNVITEQKAMLEEMRDLYIKAKEVSTVIGSKDKIVLSSKADATEERSKEKVKVKAKKVVVDEDEE